MSFRTLKLEQSLPFQNMAETSQIIIPGTKTEYHFKNRMTHVYEVSIIADLIAKKIKFKKRDELRMVCLGHDLGHPPMGHDGQRLLNRKSIEFGIIEGFSDNNNNLNIIENNSLDFNLYEQVSLIKYPEKLYENQKNLLLPVLDRYIQKEVKIWGENLKRTVACEIMDFSDEIAYGLSDLFDGFSNKYNHEEIIQFLEEELSLSSIYKSEIMLLISSIKNNDNRLFKNVLLDLKIKMIKNVLWDYSLGKLIFKDDESGRLLKNIINFNYIYFIKSERSIKEREAALVIFEEYIDHMFTCDINNIPSNMYKKKLLKANDMLEELKIRRDMIADSTDSYVLSYFGSAL